MPRSATPTRWPPYADECNFADYDELIVSTLPLKVSKWLRVDLPRKARAATGLPVQHVVASEAKAVTSQTSVRWRHGP